MNIFGKVEGLCNAVTHPVLAQRREVGVDLGREVRNGRHFDSAVRLRLMMTCIICGRGVGVALCAVVAERIALGRTDVRIVSERAAQMLKFNEKNYYCE